MHFPKSDYKDNNKTLNFQIFLEKNAKNLISANSTYHLVLSA